MSDSDNLWTAWATRRDERAFDALVRPELAHALAFARRLGCGAADAEDALQDALMRLAAPENVAPPAFGVRAWLCREVHTRARSNLRSQRRRRTREAAVSVLDRQEPGDAPIAIRDELDRALAELADDERTAVELRHLHDLDYREMAFVLGASEGACRQRVSKALAKLRRRFGEGAAALVATRPLCDPRDPGTLVKQAVGSAASAAPVAAIGGVLLMTTMHKAVLAAGVLLLLAGAGAAVMSMTRRGPPPRGEVARELAPSAPRERAPRAAAAEAASSELRTDGPAFAFPPTAFVGVRVVDTGTRAVPDATVRLLSRTMRHPPVVVAAQRTDADGIARFDRLRPHEGGLFEADVRGASGIAGATAVDVGCVTTIKVEPVRTVHLSVTRSGAPVAAHVWIDRRDDRLDSFMLIEEREVGPDGRDTVLMPASGLLHFVAGREDGVSETVELRPGGAAAEVAIEVPGASLPARIETRQGHDPVPGVDVYLNTLRISSRTTDRDGRTEIGSIPASRRMHVSLHRGGVPVVTPSAALRDADGTIVLQVDDRAATAEVSRVRVLDPEGVPIVAASVGWNETIGVAGLGQTLTGSDGTTDGIAWMGRVVVGARGCRVRLAVVGPGDNEVRLESAAWRKVRVVDEAGAPVPHAWMSFAEVENGRRMGAWLVADDEGTTSFVDEPGWKIAVRAPGVNEFADGGTLATGDVTVTCKSAADVPLGGTLGLPEGATQDRFVLTILSGPRQEHFDIGPRFSLAVRSATFVAFRVESEDGALAGEFSGAPSAGLAIPLRVRSVLRIAPRLPDGSQPAAGRLRVQVSRAGREPRVRSMLREADDAWLADVDAPGAWDVFVQCDETCGVARGEAAAPREARSIPVVLRPSGGLAVHVDTSHAIDIDARIALHAAGEDAAAPPIMIRRRDVPVDDGGRVRIDGLPAGRCDVLVWVRTDTEAHRIAAAESVEVKAGAVDDLRPDVRTLRRVSFEPAASGLRRAGMRVVPVGELGWTRRLWPSQVLEEDGREFVLAWDGEFALEDASGAPRWRVTVAPGATTARPAAR